MGDPSFLRFVPTSSATLPIDWTKMPNASKEYFLHTFCYDWHTHKHRPFPATFGDLTKFINESKFFGYMVSELVNFLLDIDELGLKKVEHWHIASLTVTIHALYIVFLESRAFRSSFSHLGREIQSQAIVPVSQNVVITMRKIKHWWRSLTQSSRILGCWYVSLRSF